MPTEYKPVDDSRAFAVRPRHYIFPAHIRTKPLVLDPSSYGCHCTSVCGVDVGRPRLARRISPRLTVLRSYEQEIDGVGPQR